MKLAVVAALAAGLAVLAVAVSSVASGAAPAPPAFPEGILGTWKGTVRSESPGGKSMEFPMALTVAPIEGRDAWSFTITYGEGERKQVRPYELLPVEGSPGRFRIDERNGIVLDAAFVGDTLHCGFSVQGNTIFARYRLADDAVEFAIDSFASGVETGGKDGAPAVTGFVLQAPRSAPV